jgi:hypothetical protein
MGVVKKPKSVRGDLEFLASLTAYLMVFLPLRGWTIRDKPTRRNVDSLVDFILRGLGVIEWVNRDVRSVHPKNKYASIYISR